MLWSYQLYDGVLLLTAKASVIKFDIQIRDEDVGIVNKCIFQSMLYKFYLHYLSENLLCGSGSTSVHYCPTILFFKVFQLILSTFEFVDIILFS